jgi:hypothetical protein
MVIGIPWEGITGGMEAIGLDHRTRELAGLSRIMMGSSSLLVTGKEIAAVLNTITTGTATTSGTSTTEIMAGTARGITRGITSGITNYESNYAAVAIADVLLLRRVACSFYVARTHLHGERTAIQGGCFLDEANERGQ